MVIIYYNEPHICYLLLFSLHVTSYSNITSVYSVEHIPGVKKTITISSRKLNLTLKMQGVHMFDGPIFFLALIF